MKIDNIKEKEKLDEILSAKNVIKHMLKIKDFVSNKHKKAVLSEMIFKITEAEGLTAEKRSNYKKKITYISEAVKNGKYIDEENYKNLIHDHVYMRKGLVDELIANPKDIDKILEKAISCIVTKGEHQKLPHNINVSNGWGRYKKAKIKVFNNKTKTWVKF